MTLLPSWSFINYRAIAKCCQICAGGSAQIDHSIRSYVWGVQVRGDLYHFSITGRARASPLTSFPLDPTLVQQIAIKPHNLRHSQGAIYGGKSVS